MMKDKGLVHIYYGDGKGKTTAAVGLVIRAAGNGKRVLLHQFLKNNDSGERQILDFLPEITCLPGEDEVKFSFQMNAAEKEACCSRYHKKMEEILNLAADYDLICLDEILYAMRAELIDKKKLISFLQNRPIHTEVILTGNGQDDDVFACADYITEMKKIRHPFDEGIPARVGIER